MLVRPVSDTPSTPPADPVAAEDGVYAALVGMYYAHRKSGAGRVDAALLTAAYRVMHEKADEATAGASSAPDGS